ncbi:MAG TPA: tetratricopeptide repeat protein, partial [Chroococcales cyanobacterium]
AERALRKALTAAGGNLTKKLVTLEALEEVFESEGNYPAEEQVLLSSMRLMRSVDDIPGLLLAATYSKLAVVNFYMNRLDRAEYFCRIALPVLKDSAGSISPDLAIALNNLGWIEYELKQYKHSESHLRQSLYILQRLFGDKDVLYGLTANNLAKVYLSVGNYQAALLWYRRCSKAMHSSVGPGSPITGEIDLRCRQLQSLLGKNAYKQARRPSATGARRQ